jgi:glycosyltransferase involved in cell wall biosynthesis
VDLAKDPATATARNTGSPRPASGRGAGGEGLSEVFIKEIIFVDDGSTDATRQIASHYPVRIIQGTGRGPGAARNLGWQAADSELIWFIDSDCVAEPDALEKLLPHMNDPQVAGVGGSYANLYPDSLIATLIHEEIVARHRRMKREVDFLATFNVIYRRDVLEELGGFNEALKLAQDAELAYRVRVAGHRLNFVFQSRVGHHHPRNLWRYLKTQARQGYYRVMLYRQHPAKIGGDSYAGVIDYLQPPLALLVLILLPFSLYDSRLIILVGISLVCLLLAQAPLAARLFSDSRTQVIRFVLFGTVRSFARGIGMALAFCNAVKGILASKHTSYVKPAIAAPLKSSGAHSHEQ